MTYGIEGNTEARVIREEVFVEEQGFREEFDETDARAWHVVLYEGGIAAATGRLFSEGGGVYHVGRVAVRKAYRGYGVGAQVMRALHRKARALGARELVLSAQVQARGFYEKLGYAAVGETYLDEHCPHVRMTLSL